MLDVSRLEVFYGEARAIRGVDLRIEDGEIASVVGPNGAGKSTLVNALAGLLRDRTGSIEMDGADLMRPAAHEVCELRDRDRARGAPDLLRHVGGGQPRARRLPPRRRATHREERLARVHELFPILRERAEQRAGTLSGGEQQMLALGRALMSGPKLLLLDEPSLGLAPVVVDTLFDALIEIHASGVSILLVEQNVTRALAISERAHLLSDGEIVLSGEAGAMLRTPRSSGSAWV